VLAQRAGGGLHFRSGPDDEKRDGRGPATVCAFPGVGIRGDCGFLGGEDGGSLGGSGTSGETTYTAIADHRLSGLALLDVCDVLAQIFGSAMAVARSLHH
jgi:hypothetical protein